MRGDVGSKRGLLRRLRRVEGQLRGIRGCVAEAIFSEVDTVDVKAREMSSAVARFVRS